ncbi:hypothetical protein V8E55_009774 [Tylopilus felleus]
MASGIDVADECISTFQQLKLGRQFKYILLTLNDDLSEIVVDKTSTASSYETFVEDLPKDQCRWAVYDFDFERDGLKRSKLCLVSWSPDDAKIKDKMLLASSHEALKHRLDGIAFEVQATDPAEISYDTVLAKALTATH